MLFHENFLEMQLAEMWVGIVFAISFQIMYGSVLMHAAATGNESYLERGRAQKTASLTGSLGPAAQQQHQHQQPREPCLPWHKLDSDGACNVKLATDAETWLGM